MTTQTIKIDRLQRQQDGKDRCRTQNSVRKGRRICIPAVINSKKPKGKECRPVARGVSRGFGRTPPCSLAKFIFNEIAEVQGTIIQPCSTVVVTYTSAVEAFAIGIQNFDRWKSSLIAWWLRSWAFDTLIILRKRCNYDVIIDHSWIINKQNFSAPLRAAFSSKNSGYGPGAETPKRSPRLAVKRLRSFRHYVLLVVLDWQYDEPWGSIQSLAWPQIE